MRLYDVPISQIWITSLIITIILIFWSDHSIITLLRNHKDTKLLLHHTSSTSPCTEIACKYNLTFSATSASCVPRACSHKSNDMELVLRNPCRNILVSSINVDYNVQTGYDFLTQQTNHSTPLYLLLEWLILYQNHSTVHHVTTQDSFSFFSKNPKLDYNDSIWQSAEKFLNQLLENMKNSKEYSLLVLEEGVLTESLLRFIATVSHKFHSIFIIGDMLAPQRFYKFIDKYGEPQFLFTTQKTSGILFSRVLQQQHQQKQGYTLLNETLYRHMGFIKRYAILSASDNTDYAFYVPIAIKFWKRILGYDTLILTVGSSWHTNFTLQMVAQRLEADQIHVQYIDAIPPFSSGTISQIGRLFIPEIFNLSVALSDYLITSDIDLVPLDASYFTSVDWNTSFHLLDVHCCGKFLIWLENSTKISALYHTPLCYIGGSIPSWKALIDQALSNMENFHRTNNTNHVTLIRTLIDRQLALERNNMDNLLGWKTDLLRWLDQHILSSSFATWKLPVFEKPYIECRILRGGNYFGDLDIAVDAHLFREGHNHENWNIIRSFLSRALPHLDVLEIEIYRQQFLNTMGQDT
jgi:hypothetical protein